MTHLNKLPFTDQHVGLSISEVPEHELAFLGLRGMHLDHTF